MRTRAGILRNAPLYVVGILIAGLAAAAVVGWTREVTPAPAKSKVQLVRFDGSAASLRRFMGGRKPKAGSFGRCGVYMMYVDPHKQPHWLVSGCFG
jgi:hypothetical protein